MDIAVVVPVLDEALLAESLAAELRALGREAEVLVVDGGSQDGTRELLERAAEGRFAVASAPRGRASQMNGGARMTRAPLIVFLHADTRLPEGGLAAARAAVSSGALGGCFRLRIASRDPRLRLASQIITWRSRLGGSASGDQALFATRDAFERAGGFREIALCEDLDFVARLSALGRFACVDATVETSARRWERNGVMRTIGLMWMLRLGYHLGVDPRTLHRLYGPEAR